MFTKLMIFSLALFSAHAYSGTSEPIYFDNINAAKNWFSKIYPKYEVIQDKKNPEIHAFYGVKGSGIIRVDGWFFSCQKNGKYCSIICMADFGESRNFKPAEIRVEDSNLIFKANNVQMIFKLKK